MITVVPSNQRHFSDIGWLQTYWHFSFSDYYDPNNMQWGKLRVFNDDVIQGGGGFGMHPHRDMEIVTYVVEGELEHQDRLGNRGTVLPGEVQVMSAGRGITHSEFNHSKDKPVHLMQLWITPRKQGTRRAGSKSGSPPNRGPASCFPWFLRGRSMAPLQSIRTRPFTCRTSIREKK